MNYRPLLVFFLTIAPLIASANDLADSYFSKKPALLTPQEKQALLIGKKWQTGQATSKPVAGRDGAIQFVYGAGQTQIMCAVLQVCDVALESGEMVNNLEVGDPRFLVSPAVTSNGASQQLHLLIKALDVGLDTSLVVTTDRRAYHFRLRSSRHDFMPYVSFIYPDKERRLWQAIQQEKIISQEKNTLPETGEYLGNLDFNYAITGRARIIPTRVFNDGVKTIIEMPKAMNQTEAPALLVLKKGGLFRKTETVMVNYRIQHNRYIVDTVFDKAMLVSGVGRSQDRITITKGKA